MAFFKLCKGDPLVGTLQEVFKANPVRIPERRVQPMCVVAKRREETAFRGELGPLLAGRANIEAPAEARKTSTLPDLSAKRTRKVKIELGLDILSSFLLGFSLPAGDICAKFDGATTVTFSFQDVSRDWVDVNWIGRALAGRALDPQNPAARIFLESPRWEGFLIDSVIASSGFTINVTTAKDTTFALDVPAIQTLVGQAGVDISISASTSRQLAFAGQDALTFAFTAVRLFLDEHGNITSIPPGGSATLASEDGRGAPSPPEVVPLYSEPAMIDWDDSVGSQDHQT